MGGLGLPQLLQAEGNSKTGSSNKSIIMIYMLEGPLIRTCLKSKLMLRLK